MTQRARQAIINYWLLKHAAHWRRPLRFFLMFLSCSLLFSGVSFAAEAQSKVVKENSLLKLISRETKKLTPEEQAKADEEKKEKAKKYALLDPTDEDEKTPGKTKNVTGEVGAHNNFGLAVELPPDPVDGTGREAWFNFTSKTKLSGLRSFKDLQDGDTVTLTYKETDTGKRILKSVAFVRKKPKEEPVVLSIEGTIGAAQAAKAVKS